MYPNIMHIYGPLYINSYGLFIALGILIFCVLIKQNKEFNKLVNFETFKDIFFFSIITGVAGGRLLWAIEEWKNINILQLFAIWQPGYSFLGTMVALLIFVPLYLKKLNVPALPFLDTVAIYAPLLHAIARVGCFFCRLLPRDANKIALGYRLHPPGCSCTKQAEVYIFASGTTLYLIFIIYTFFMHVLYFSKKVQS